jgi:hypothetical protein
MKLDSLIANMESASRDSRHSSTIAGGDFSGAEMAEAARQLRAAPDLLAALKDAETEISAWRKWAAPGDGPVKPIVTSAVLETVRAAIAKAEGRGA